MKTLDSILSGRDNNFNLIRFLAAAMVIVAHSYTLTVQSWKQIPLPFIRDVHLGGLAVEIFFITSGFLISMSFLRQSNIWLYLEARILRIFPALIVAVLFTSLVLGPIFTKLSLGEYFTHTDLYEYILINSTLILNIVQIRYELPGVFTENLLPVAVNGSLWTLPYEVWMYIMLLIIGVIRILNNRKRFNIFFALFVLSYLVGSMFLLESAFYAKLDTYANFALYFLMGTFFYVNRNWIPINGYILLTSWLVLWLLRFSISIYDVFYYFALSYGVFWLALVPGGFIRRFNRLGDYSYGLYIYAFPIQQAIIALFPAISPVFLIVLAFFVTLFFAVVSWHVIEKPALSYKGDVYQRALSWLQNAPWYRKRIIVEQRHLDS